MRKIYSLARDIVYLFVWRVRLVNQVAKVKAKRDTRSLELFTGSYDLASLFQRIDAFCYLIVVSTCCMHISSSFYLPLLFKEFPFLTQKNDNNKC